ncbi:MAG: hypothetical protein U9N42_10060, partial [Campylobacterota bacterium]|nr:hypothetical protein [Campylobacterota bacterium]
MSYLRLWIWWVSWTLLLSISFASLLSSFMSMITFFNSSATTLNAQTFDALVKITLFWFPFSWALIYMIVLIISIKK